MYLQMGSWQLCLAIIQHHFTWIRQLTYKHTNKRHTDRQTDRQTNKVYQFTCLLKTFLFATYCIQSIKGFMTDDALYKFTFYLLTYIVTYMINYISTWLLLRLYVYNYICENKMMTMMMKYCRNSTCRLNDPKQTDWLHLAACSEMQSVSPFGIVESACRVATILVRVVSCR